MQQNESGKPILIILLVVVTILVLFVASFAAVILMDTMRERPAIVLAPSEQVPARPDAPPILTKTDDLLSLSATPATTEMVSLTELAQLTVTSTIAVPTLPEPTATRTASPTAVPAPTLAPPTGTPSVIIVRVDALRAYVYDGPFTSNTIIGGVERGDELVVLGSSGTRYMVRMYGPGDGRNRIEGSQGWIDQDQVSPPSQLVPVITP